MLGLSSLHLGCWLYWDSLRTLRLVRGCVSSAGEEGPSPGDGARVLCVHLGEGSSSHYQAMRMPGIALAYVLEGMRARVTGCG